METRLHFRWKLILIPVIILSVLYLLFKVPSTVGTFVVGLLIYMILSPMVNRLCRIYDVRPLWTVLVMLLSFFSIGLLLSLANYLMMNELPDLSKQLPAFSQSFNSILAQVDSKFSFVDQFFPGKGSSVSQRMLGGFLNSGAIEAFLNNSTQTLFRIMAMSFSFVMALIISVYLILDEGRILDLIEERLPKKFLTLNRKMWHDMVSSISGYFMGLFILGLILFFSSWIGLSLLRVHYSFLLSVWIGITIIIPYLGPFIGSIPASVMALSQGVAPGVYTILFLTLLQFFVTSILSPKIIGEIIGVHPVLVILALIAGGELGGMVGMIVAVPLTSVVLIFLKYYWPMFLED